MMFYTDSFGSICLNPSLLKTNTHALVALMNPLIKTSVKKTAEMIMADCTLRRFAIVWYHSIDIKDKESITTPSKEAEDH